MEIILSIGFCVTGFAIFLLSRQKEVKPINKFAVAILSLWFLRFILFYLKTVYSLTSTPWLLIIDQNLFFLDGVFFFWFTKSLTKDKFSILKESVHLLPFIISILLTVSIYVSLTNEQLYLLHQDIGTQVENKSFIPSIEELIFILVVLIQNVIYTILSYKKVRQYDRKVHSFYSTIGENRINWLSKLFKAWAVLLVLPLIIYFLNYIYHLIDLSILDSYFIISLVISAVYFSVHIINQHYAVVLPEKSTKKRSIIVDDKALQYVFSNLEEHMKSQKPYLDDDLTLGKLSEQLKIKPTTLSSAINTQTSGNFYDFINFYRIESTKKELETTEEQVIIIAYNNGFRSKSTFNKVFKEQTGVSPTQFKKQFCTSK
jgi:AraC-like DNA-binding protein